MEDAHRRLFAFALEHGTVLFPALALGLLAFAFFLFRRHGRFRLARRLVASLCLVLIFVCAFAFHFTRSVHRALAHRASDFSFRLLGDDSSHRLSDYAGRIVVLNFWATWCKPCLQELPALETLAKAHQGDVVVLSVSDEDVGELRAALPTATTRINGYFSDASPEDAIGRMAYQGRPTTLIIGRDGQVRGMLVGAQTLSDFEAAIRRAL